ncbi:FCD domain-containing protein [Saccharothrix sp. 6-C]|uniref:FCD domain-containing protein n=1 Tax=Saccharothrix sp. 6-C TaxID=2781735 RepID=UPI001917719A|nr:FCD domain-containing protein [Saccharothrix sp. 6-C]
MPGRRSPARPRAGRQTAVRRGVGPVARPGCRAPGENRPRCTPRRAGTPTATCVGGSSTASRRPDRASTSSRRPRPSGSARRTAADVEAIREAAEGLRALPGNPDHEYLPAHRRFHAALCRASHNVLLIGRWTACGTSPTATAGWRRKSTAATRRAGRVALARAGLTVSPGRAAGPKLLRDKHDRHVRSCR